ncbi:hypothetical protein [Streptodolium elevatio]|uniref:Uncharacterized protein n=1 Tax=Streptodolium elevatio TaxID=3157996 RepID=A0ABV3DF77_9ACTN
MAGIHEGTAPMVTVAVAGLTQLVTAAGDVGAKVVSEVRKPIAALVSAPARAPSQGVAMGKEKSFGG